MSLFLYLNCLFSVSYQFLNFLFDFNTRFCELKTFAEIYTKIIFLINIFNIIIQKWVICMSFLSPICIILHFSWLKGICHFLDRSSILIRSFRKTSTSSVSAAFVSSLVSSAFYLSARPRSSQLAHQWCPVLSFNHDFIVRDFVEAFRKSKYVYCSAFII